MLVHSEGLRSMNSDLSPLSYAVYAHVQVCAYVWECMRVRACMRACVCVRACEAVSVCVAVERVCVTAYT